VKIISLHLETCSSTLCPNRDVCYHNDRKWKRNKFLESSLISQAIAYAYKHNATIYASVCNYTDSLSLNMLDKIDNLNLTMSSDVFRVNRDYLERTDKIQISVWNLKEAFSIKLPKIYLVKDQQTFLEVMALLGNKDVGEIYFPFEQGWVARNPNRHHILMMRYSKVRACRTDIDICSKHMLLEGTCP